jgi:hypothetical protein
MAADTFIEQELLFESNYLGCICEDKCFHDHVGTEGVELANSTTDVTLVSGINCLLSLFRKQSYTLGCDEQ